MKQSAKVLLTLTAPLVLGACASTQPEPDSPAIPAIASSHLAALAGSLPGFYSNFAQAYESAEPARVSDLTIRSAGSDADGSVRMVLEQSQRDSDRSRYQLYTFAADPSGEKVVLRFAPVSSESLQNPDGEWLAESQAAIRAGCEISLTPTPNGLVGETRPGTCRFRHPEAGDVGLIREISIRGGEIIVAERLVDSAGNSVGSDRMLIYGRHREFSGWAGQLVDRNDDPADISAWRLAEGVAVWSDGRTLELTDAAGDVLEFGLQLAQVRWRTDQPLMLRLAVIDLANGESVAYAWSDANADRLGINLEWFQAGLSVVGLTRN